MVVAEAYARALRALLPPGRLWQLTTGSVLSRTLVACADELTRVDGRAEDLLTESDPRTTDELLPDFERVLALAPIGTLAQRQALVAALIVRRQRYRPVDFQTVLAPLLGVPPANVVVIETSHAQAVAIGDAREIFRFFVYRDPALPGTYDIAGAQAMIDRMKPSHTVGHVGESVSFRTDDPLSLCDRDLLGS